MGIMVEVHAVTTYNVRHGEDLFTYLAMVDADEVGIPVVVQKNQVFHNILITFTLEGRCAVVRVLQ